MFIRCSTSCHSFFRQTYTTDTYNFLCCSGTNDSFGLWLIYTQVGTCTNVLKYKSLPDSTPQRHAATIPGIKLSYLVKAKQSVNTVSQADFRLSTNLNKLHVVMYQKVNDLYANRSYHAPVIITNEAICT